MSEQALKTLSDIATEAHTRIQKDFEDINPIVGVSQGLRNSGFPADAMTIDCLKTGKRIIIILHDQKPGIVSYQFSYRDKDPSSHFDELEFSELTASTLYEWMKGYFSSAQ